MSSSFFSFPNPVNEKTARTVAAGVVLLAAIALLTGWYWISALMGIGFLLRVANGPRLSPLGMLANRVIAPRLGQAKLVPGPPKRFAQTIGLVVTTIAAVAWLGFGSTIVTVIMLVLILVAAGLESAAGICLGCIAFGYLMRIGVIPPETCEACANISLRTAAIDH